MLYNIGALELDTRPFSAEDVDRDASADFASKAIVGAIKGREAVGEGDDTITLSGQLLPYKIGGLDQLELAHELRRAQQPLPVVRGDGKSLGWFTIDRVRESHSELSRTGVGHIIKHTISLTKTRPPSGGDAGGLIGSLLSLFGALGR